MTPSGPNPDPTYRMPQLGMRCAKRPAAVTHSWKAGLLVAKATGSIRYVPDGVTAGMKMLNSSVFGQSNVSSTSGTGCGPKIDNSRQPSMYTVLKFLARENRASLKGSASPLKRILGSVPVPQLG